MELLEASTVDTYGTFLLESEQVQEIISTIPSLFHRSNYAGEILYEYDEFMVRPGKHGVWSPSYRAYRLFICMYCLG
ncbi:hypothetical protein EON64_01660 [archaeon]|nr:MAG: hypothetical protein EON64_01660 [archaeon]